MTINDYVKMMVVSYQDKHPDTRTIKNLVLSRKSLWEKEKLDIEKNTRIFMNFRSFLSNCWI